MEFKHRDDEFIEQRIEKVVFIETKQYKELTEGPVYGKYFEDTGVYNVFPGTLFGKGHYLGEIISEEVIMPTEGFYRAWCRILFGWRENKNRATCTVYGYFF